MRKREASKTAGHIAVYTVACVVELKVAEEGENDSCLLRSCSISFTTVFIAINM